MMTLEETGRRAREAEPVIRVLSTEEKNRVLHKAADNLRKFSVPMHWTWKTDVPRECRKVCWIVCT